MSARYLTLTLGAGAIALGSCGASSSAGGSSSPGRPASGSPSAAAACHPLHARVLAADRQVRVFSLGHVVYGCFEKTGKRYEFGQTATCIGTPHAGPVTVAAELAAYGSERCGIDTGFAQVIVRRMSDGRQLRADSATTNPLGPESYSSVDSLVLRGDAAVAWIGVGTSLVGHTADIEVHRAGKHGQELLDSGAAIDRHSLRLHGSKLTWKHGSATRSAQLA